MKRIVLLLLCSILLNVSADAGKRNAKAEIPILAWYSIPPGEFSTLERYQELRDCGFTYTFAHIYKLEDAMKALDLSAKVGIKSVFMCPELEKTPEEVAKKVRKHPGLGAYFLRDEPGNDAFEGLGNWARRIESVDKEHPCYLNLLPVHAFPPGAYEEHVRLFNEKVNLPQLSYDHYPVNQGENGLYVNPMFWKNLEVISAAAKEVNKTFWAFALATAHGPYPIPDLGHLRLQMYSNLAYGAQLLQYFTYWNPGTEIWNFHEAPITQKGKRSPVYEVVRNMNNEIQKRAFIFKGCSVESVYHMGETIPEGTTRLTQLPSRFLELDTHGKNALVSTISNNGHRYVVIQNTSITDALSLDIQTDNTVKLILLDGSIQQASKYGPLFILPVGDILVFEY